MIKLFLTLFASWVVNPASVLIAHQMGLGSDSWLVASLIVIGLTIPFQLVFNEFLALAQARGNYSIKNTSISLILVFQLAVTIFSLINANNKLIKNFSNFDLLLISFFGVIGTYFSYLCALRYYKLVADNLISSTSAMIIGALPGVTSSLIYLAISFAPLGWHEAMISVVMLPTFVQLLYLISIDSSSIKISNVATANKSQKSIYFFYIVVIILGGASYLATGLRATLGSYNLQYSAVIISMLNVIFSILLVFSRSLYLFDGRNPERPLLAVLVLLSIVVPFLNFSGIVFSAVCFVIIQLFIVLVIVSSRRILAAKTS